eukprot:scaffold391_cov412-Pavlova_lutheri.AAC.7
MSGYHGLTRRDLGAEEPPLRENKKGIASRPNRPLPPSPVEARSSSERNVCKSAPHGRFVTHPRRTLDTR